MHMQMSLFRENSTAEYGSRHKQLLKWIGNKQRFAAEIASHFPSNYGTYFEPFIGSAAVMSTLRPNAGIGSDTFASLVEIWQTLVNRPNVLKQWYRERYDLMAGSANRVVAYENIKASYNANPNAADLLFLCRSCYGGVVRFRKADGYMSTPCGAHSPIKSKDFDSRVDDWHQRLKGCLFKVADYRAVMRQAKAGDMIYCDPPYTHTQAILYGAQDFSLPDLFAAVAECKERGAFIAVSIDGSKRSGTYECALPIPEGLFEREIFVDCGRSMLKRFQMNGATLESECVADRLLLTY
jgi:DNA adenine methylase